LTGDHPSKTPGGERANAKRKRVEKEGTGRPTSQEPDTDSIFFWARGIIVLGKRMNVPWPPKQTYSTWTGLGRKWNKKEKRALFFATLDDTEIRKRKRDGRIKEDIGQR